MSAPAAHAQPTCALPDIVHTPHALVPDGDLSDWPAGARTVAFEGHAPPPDRNRARVRFAWDAIALYAAFEVDDHRLNVVPRDRLPLPDWFDPDAPTPPGPESFPTDTLAMLYMSDAIELFITADTARSARQRPQDYQIIVDLRGAVGVLRGDAVLARLRPDWTQPKTVDRGVRVAAGTRLRGTLNLNDDLDDGYTVELAVPWASLGLASPAPGRPLRLLAAVDDNEDPLPPAFEGRPDSLIRYDTGTHCGVRDYGPPATWSRTRLAAPVPSETSWMRWIGAVLSLVVVAGAAWTLRRRRTGAAANRHLPAETLPASADGTPSLVTDEVAEIATPPVPPSADARWLARVDGAINEGMAEPGFGVEALAHDVGISPRQLQRRLVALTGLTPVQYVRRARLTRAAVLLDARAGTVAEVAARVGLDPATLSRQFRAQYGTSPSAWALRDAKDGR